MNRIVVDQALRDTLANFDKPVEFSDGAGNILGYFHPAAEAIDYEGYECPTSDEELERRARDGGGRSLEEIMADLEKRP